MKRVLSLVLIAITLCSLGQFASAQEESAEPASQTPLPEFDRQKVERQTRFAAAWLLAQQDKDGLWRSNSYGALKAGGATTSLAVYALSHLPDSSRRPYRKPIAAGFAGLLPGIKERGYVCAPDGTADYPVYATSLALAASRRMSDWDLLTNDQRQELAAFVLSAQVAEVRGFTSDQNVYGGWDLLGVSRPEKLTHGTTMSVTAAAIEGLAGFEGEKFDQARKAADLWLTKTQRLPASGGFVFSPDDADAGNKAGRENEVKPEDGDPGGDPLEEFGIDDGFEDPSEKPKPKDKPKDNPEEPTADDEKEETTDTNTDTDAEAKPLGPALAYGSTTADGINALIAVGVSKDDERVQAAATWLVENPAYVAVPGLPFENENDWGIGLRFYYYANLARGFPLLPEKFAAVQRRKLAAHILSLQNEDGSFVNSSSRMREDDPLLATSFAIIALGEILAQEEAAAAGE